MRKLSKIAKYLWGCLWREVGGVARAIQIAIVAIPAVMTGVFRLFGEEWSRDMWSSQTWLIITFVAVVAVIFYGVFRRGYILEQEKQPKIRISDPVQTTDPKESPDHASRWVGVEIENLSTAHLKNIEVREEEFINADGHKSDLRRHFMRAEDRYNDPTSYSYDQSFDLNGKGTKQRIDVAVMHEKAEAPWVLMLYATKNEASQFNLIPQNKFPHELKIRVTADDMAMPADKWFKLYIENGFLRMIALDKDD